MTMASDHPAVVDHAAFAVRRTIEIAAPVEKVWSAVTEPQHITRWLGEARFDGTGPGATGTLSWPDRGSVPLRVEAMDPLERVSYRWTNDEAGDLPEQVDPDRSTVFTFTLEPIASGTRLTVVETGFERSADPAGNLESHRRGWDTELDELTALLEGR